MVPLQHQVLLDNQKKTRIVVRSSLQSIFDLEYIYKEVFSSGCEEAVTWAVFARPLEVESAQVK